MSHGLKSRSYGAPARFVHWLAVLFVLMLPAGAAAETKTIVAFGDSLTAGYRLAQDEGFAPQLETVLNRRGLDVRVVNAGVSGETSAGGRARVGWTLDNMAVKPDLLILELGANDMLRGLNPRETLRNLNAIIEEVDARGIPILLTGMLATPNVGEANFRYFNSIYPFLADRHGTAFYPFFLRGVALRQDYLLDDFLHPNANGVRIIAQGIAPTVVEALQ